MDNILWQILKFKNRTKFSVRYCIENRNCLETLVGCGKIWKKLSFLQAHYQYKHLCMCVEKYYMFMKMFDCCT